MCSLQERSPHGVELLISDSHARLKAARKTVFPDLISYETSDLVVIFLKPLTKLSTDRFSKFAFS